MNIKELETIEEIEKTLYRTVRGGGNSARIYVPKEYAQRDCIVLIKKDETNKMEEKRMKDIKKNCEELTKLIETCFDDNNEDDGKTFDERLHQKLQEHPHLKKIYDDNNIGEE